MRTRTNKQSKVDEKAQAAKQNLTEKSARSDNTVAVCETKKTTQSKHNHRNDVNTHRELAKMATKEKSKTEHLHNSCGS